MNKEQLSEFKSVKQRLSTLHLVIKKDFKNDQLPSRADTEQFIAISAEMNSLCQEKWRTTMDDYIDLLTRFQNSVKGKDLQAAQDGFHSLLDRKATCHKKYRQK